MRKKIRRQNGLTLVEIMVAGVLLVAIALGASSLIPVGFKSNQRAKDIAVANQSVNKIMEEINSLDFADIVASPVPSPEPPYPSPIIDTRNYVYPSQKVTVNGQDYPRPLKVDNRTYRLDMVVYKGKHNQMVNLQDPDDPVRLVSLPFTLSDMMDRVLNYIDAPAHATSAPDSCTITAPSASTVYTNDSITFTGTSTYSGTVTYTWNFGDAQTGLGSSTTKTYAAAGTYTVSLTAKKGSSTTPPCYKTLIVQARTVNISVTPSSSGFVNTTSFGFSASCDGCGTGAIYRWNFGSGEGAEVYGATQSHTFSSTGAKPVTVTVENVAGSPSGTTTVQVDSSSGSITASPTTAKVGVPFTFTVNCTNCGSSPTYVWNFGDFSSPATTATTTHAYSQPGNYTASVTVTGGSNPSFSYPLTVTSDYAAQLEIAPGTNGVAGPESSAETTEFTVTTKSDGYQNGTLPVTYTLNYGDGSTPVVLVDSTPGDSTFPTATKKYTVGGTYVVTLNATDGTNASTTTTNVAVGSSVTIAASETEIEKGDSVTLTASALGVGSSPAYSWNFGDGATASGSASASHTYSQAGTYNVTLTVQGGTNPSATKTITVTSPDSNGGQSEMKKIFIKVSPWSNTPNKQYMTTIVFLKANNDE